MKECLDKTRQLLSELESEAEAGNVSSGDRDFSALELPLIIQEVADDLQPLLSPIPGSILLLRIPSLHSGKRQPAPATQHKAPTKRCCEVQPLRYDLASTCA